MLDIDKGKGHPGTVKSNILKPGSTKGRFYQIFLSLFLIFMLFLPFIAVAGHEARATSFTMEIVSDGSIDDGVLVLYPDEHYFFYLRLTNTGDVDDSYNISITTDMPEWTVSFQGGVTETLVDVSMASSGDNVQDVIVLVSIPDTAKKSQVADLTFTAVSETNPGLFKTQDLMIMINYIQPHILLDTEEHDKLVEPGGAPASFLIGVENLGFDTVEYYPPVASDFTLPDTWTIEITGGGNVIEIGPAGTTGFYVNVSAPESAGVQERVKLTISGYTTDLNSTLLPVDITVKVKQIHNLEFDGPNEFLVLEPLKENKYSVSVKNSGNGPETVEVILNTPGAADAWKPAVSESSMILSVDSEFTLVINFTPTLDAVNDLYMFRLDLNLIDSGAVVQNESFTTEVEIRYVPDLAIDNDDIQFSDSSVEPDQAITINATVHNLATVPASDVVVYFMATTAGGSQKAIGTVTLPLIDAGGTATASIDWNVDPATSSISVIVDNDNNKFEIDENNNVGLKSVFVINPQSDPSSDDSSGSGFYAGIGSIGAIVVLTALVSITSVLFLVTINTEAGKYSFLTFFMPLYSKVRREDVLMHETREMVYDFVKAHPGQHFRAIMNKLSLTNGTLAHHLYTLEKQEFIKSERDGAYKRFYPRGYQLSGSVMEVNGVQKKILDTIESNPGISQKNLATILTISPPTVNYHIKTMVGARLVELQRNGKETSCYRIKAE